MWDFSQDVFRFAGGSFFPLVFHPNWDDDPNWLSHFWGWVKPSSPSQARRFDASADGADRWCLHRSRHCDPKTGAHDPSVGASSTVDDACWWMVTAKFHIISSFQSFPIRFYLFWWLLHLLREMPYFNGSAEDMLWCKWHLECSHCCLFVPWMQGEVPLARPKAQFLWESWEWWLSKSKRLKISTWCVNDPSGPFYNLQGRIELLHSGRVQSISSLLVQPSTLEPCLGISEKSLRNI